MDYEGVMNNNIVEKALEFAKKCHCKDNSGHDFEHILRVLHNAEVILKGEKDCDEIAVKMGAILHDVDDYKVDKNGHKVEAFLKENCDDKELSNKVKKIVETISFSSSGSNPDFDMIEQKIVSDADKLDAMGAMGVCRAVIYSAVTNRKLFDNDELPKDNLSYEEYKDKMRKGNHTINHFFDKLLKLKGAMQTKTGKLEAKKRHKFMISFLEQFFVEVKADKCWFDLLDKFRQK